MSTKVLSARRFEAPGFTLAEILIAISIFALLVSIVMGTFSGVFSRTGQQALERSKRAMARSCLMRMTTDLANTFVLQEPFFVPPQTGQDPSPFRFVAADSSVTGGPGVRMQFASRAHVDFNADGREGIAIIRYYLEAMDEGPDPTFRLRRADVLSDEDQLPELANDPVLCENIRALKITFSDADGESSEEWDSSSADYGYATPQSVRIRLELAATEDVTVFQTMVRLPAWRPASGKV